MKFTIDRMTAEDWPDVRAIYAAGIESGNATFETEAPPWEKWTTKYMQEFRFVARSASGLGGWAALTRVSDRCVYSGVAEVSVYVAPAAQGLGIGAALLNALIEASEAGGIWTLQAGIFPENEASLRLHRKCGFREIGRRERVGKLRGVWRDSLLLERRSRIAGVG